MLAIVQLVSFLKSGSLRSVFDAGILLRVYAALPIVQSVEVLDETADTAILA